MTGEAEMGFTLQGAGPFLHWLTLGILCVMPVVIGIIAYKLGGLPGEIARARRHPQAEAISICGWMGIVTLVLWPVAMVWAHLVPAGAAAVDHRDGKRSAFETPHRAGDPRLRQGDGVSG